jgi:hypothetical protein
MAGTARDVTTIAGPVSRLFQIASNFVKLSRPRYCTCEKDVALIE